MIFGAVTILGIVSWYFTPEEKWLPREHIIKALRTADGNADEPVHADSDDVHEDVHEDDSKTK